MRSCNRLFRVACVGVQLEGFSRDDISSDEHTVRHVESDE